MFWALIALITTIPSLQVSPHTCFAPCEVRVTYRSPEGSRSIAIVLATADGVVTTSEEPASDHTRQRWYKSLGPGDYQVTLFADGKVIGKEPVQVISQTGPASSRISRLVLRR